MTSLTIRELLAGRLNIGAEVTVEGWIRTRRDSKAGSLVLKGPRWLDASTDPRWWPRKALPEQQNEVPTSHHAHCAVGLKARIVRSAGEGSGRGKVKADSVSTCWVQVENTDHYPVASKRHTMEAPPDRGASAARTNTFGAWPGAGCLSMEATIFSTTRIRRVPRRSLPRAMPKRAGAMFRVLSTLGPSEPAA